MNVTATPIAKLSCSVSVIPYVANSYWMMSQFYSTVALVSNTARLRIGETNTAHQKLEFNLGNISETDEHIIISGVYTDKHFLCLHICLLLNNRISRLFLCCFHVLAFDDDITYIDTM